MVLLLPLYDVAMQAYEFAFVTVQVRPIAMSLMLSVSVCRYTLPLSELGGDFYDELKSVSSGYASFDYEEAEYR